VPEFLGIVNEAKDKKGWIMAVINGKKIKLGSCIILILLLGLFSTAIAGDKVTFTNVSVDFYGTMEGLQEGDVIKAYDPEGVLCGVFTVRKAGHYGFMHIYGDDAFTVLDEGASPGDPITFEINGMPASSSGPDESIWTSDGEQRHVNLNW